MKFVRPVTVVMVMAALQSATALAQVPAVGAQAEVRDAAGRLAATAEFREGRGEVLIAIRFANPPVLAGTHAVHINDVGRCDPPDFITSGEIFNPYSKKHGRLNPEGAEVGDLPNVDFSGAAATYNTSAPGATLGSGIGALLGPRPTALVVFSGEDDQLTDPDGNAGARIACGVITPVASPASAAKPAGSPTAAVSPSPALKPAASLSPVQLVPTLIIAPPTPSTPSTLTTSATPAGSSRPAALVIGILGVCLIAAGFVLRRQRNAN